jgi:predicted metal-dependent enzyme (double-stranded beta helix superfamily)
MTLALNIEKPTGLPIPLEVTALPEAAAFLTRSVTDPEFLGTLVSPFLERAEREAVWYVASRHDAPDGSYSLQVFVWPSGSWTKIHDHSSWGALCCAFGSVVEERYERLDDGSVADHARLRRIWQREWRRGDIALTVLPYDGGIHRIGNPSESPAISIHLYGLRLGAVDGRDYDPSREYVCDRRDD